MKHPIFSFVVAGLLALGMCSAQAAAPATVIQTDAGPVRGLDQGEMFAWMGIPYAAAPTGELRWAPPQTPTPWSSPRDASAYGSFCPQNADLGVFGQPGGSEDCLNINIFVGKTARNGSAKLPVSVWIHGGSLWVGAGRDYDPSQLAIEGKAVVVTFNYRLGLLGFFAHPALRSEVKPLANYGLMDQQLALDWVQRNIAAFGGDPDNVTISGESSGGGSVLLHVVAPNSAGKFQHAIDMSGAAVALRFPTFGAPKPLEWTEKNGEAFSEAVGCAGKSDAATLACLRALPVATVLAKQKPYLISQVVLDGKVLPLHPADAFRTGQFNRVTLINGTTRDEGAFFAGFVENETGVPMDEAGYATTMRGYFGTHADAVMAQYPVNRYATPSDAMAAAVTDMLFACPARAINRWASVHTPTYVYEFSDRTAPSYLKPTSFALGAAHTFELAYLFPGFHGGAGIPVTLNPMQSQLAKQMVRLWTTADQATDGKTLWQRYQPAQDNFLNLALPQARVSTGFGEGHQCGFWDRTGVY